MFVGVVVNVFVVAAFLSCLTDVANAFIVVFDVIVIFAADTLFAVVVVIIVADASVVLIVVFIIDANAFNVVVDISVITCC